MSLEDLRAKMKKLEEPTVTNPDVFKKKGFVKEQVRKSTVAKASRLARAGNADYGPAEIEIVHTPKPSNPLRKVERASIRLADLMTDDDVAADLRVVREAKEAMQRIYDPAAKRLVYEPDHKTRMAAAAFSRQYTEGMPVARQIQITAEMGGLDEALARIKDSPVARQIMEVLGEVVPPVERI